jgi:hypothetical protein
MLVSIWVNIPVATAVGTIQYSVFRDVPAALLEGRTLMFLFVELFRLKRPAGTLRTLFQRASSFLSQVYIQGHTTKASLDTESVH